jgi:ribosomal protein L13
MGHSAEIELFLALTITNFHNFLQCIYLLCCIKYSVTGKKFKQYLKRHWKTRLYLVTSDDLKKQRTTSNNNEQQIIVNIIEQML